MSRNAMSGFWSHILATGLQPRYGEAYLERSQPSVWLVVGDDRPVLVCYANQKRNSGI